MTVAVATLGGDSAIVVLQTDSADVVLDALGSIVGFALLSAAVGGATAFAYRWYVGDEVPDGIAILLGLTAVTLWLNAEGIATGNAIIGDTALLDPVTAVFTVIALLASAIAADLGRRVGDRLARDVTTTGLVASARDLQDVGQVVRAAGRAFVVELPDPIDDLDGCDPVDRAITAKLEGLSLVFPRGLTVDELRDRLVERLRDDYGVAHVDVDLAADGTIEHLAIGSRVAGIGPTLAPGTAAVAVRGDPAFSASPGDAVEVWTVADGDHASQGVDGSSKSSADSVPESTHVVTAELRGAVGDVVTLAVDEDDVDALDSTSTYRLVTLPATPGADRELLSILRTADEVVTAIEVDEGGSLVGATVESLGVPVLVVDSDEGPRVDPDDDRPLDGGETIYVLGTPAQVRRLDREVDSAARQQGDRRRIDGRP